ncbi:MAG TPA: polysaccharide deacetylase family protein [Acidobacteriaceae bacterium]|nr:polysaccharide deacetylase family protein [Acidobacteriaceae bacterium]
MLLAILPVILLALCAAASAQSRQIAITFDDLPVHGPLPPGETRLDVAKQVIAALRNAHVPPTYGFVNAIHLEQQPDTLSVLKAWRAAGNPLGNHTWSHPNLNQIPLPEFEANIARDEPTLQSLMPGGDWNWFRFPYLAEGDTPEKRTGIREYLAQHGYRIAGVTMSFADYDWNEPYARCSEKNDRESIAWLERSYLNAADHSIGFDRTLANELYGHEIPYVLLMHIGAFDGHMLPRLLALYQRRGFSFVSLEQAEADPFYRIDTNLSLPPGPDTLEGLANARHLALPKSESFSAQLNTACR